MLVGLVKVLLIFFIKGILSFKLLAMATSLAIPNTLKQSPLLGVMSNFMIVSLPKIFE